MTPTISVKEHTECWCCSDGHRFWLPWAWPRKHSYTPLRKETESGQASTCAVSPRVVFKFVQIVLVLTLSFFLALTVFSLMPWPLDRFDSAFSFQSESISIDPDSPDYPRKFLSNVVPVPCHSHNDYWRTTPLYAALGTGCVGIEADIWLVEDQLYVGHALESVTMTGNGTLGHMYIEPLVKILDAANRLREDYPQQPYRGVFEAEPSQTLTLLIDIKTAGAETWPYLYEALTPLRERGWLSHWNGTHRIPRPITVVGTGATPYDLVVANQTHRDIFLDAPLANLMDPSDVETIRKFKYNPSNSHFASAPLVKAIGDAKGLLSSEQRATLREQIRNARARGLIPRYWGTPRWPRGFRNQIWEILLNEDVGILNVDDLRAVRKGHWGFWPG
ncbi:hypothetical protein MPH_11882 [Macrophomina phaseolina MS6]|uniref:Altered inheritance of mitochondria protein 6 n=1 Tax=Macrophomina phaseolina (strain MS6) TaxID=1126212 RepID=K2S2E6_MACPH|nr:hypothetical protein MPH_11882 [Macrophomina phaseolina MS6]